MATLPHRNITPGAIHVAHNWECANQAARLGLAGLVSGDVGKIALQLDDWSYWSLRAVNPLTWARVGGTELTAATTAQAETGTDDATYMTPAKTAAAIAVRAPGAATASVAGLVKLATTAAVAGGTSAELAVVPAALRELLAGKSPLPISGTGVGEIMSVSIYPYGGSYLPAGGRWFVFVRHIVGIFDGGDRIMAAPELLEGKTWWGFAIRIE